MNNQIKEVATMLDLELGEVFKIIMSSHKNPFGMYYMLTEDGLKCSYYNDKDVFYGHSQCLEGLILGKHKVVKLKEEEKIGN